MAKQYRDDEYLQKIGKRLTDIRYNKNLSQEALAELTGLDARQIGRIERAETNSTVSMIKKIADALNIEVGDILNT